MFWTFDICFSCSTGVVRADGSVEYDLRTILTLGARWGKPEVPNLGNPKRSPNHQVVGGMEKYGTTSRVIRLSMVAFGHHGKMWNYP